MLNNDAELTNTLLEIRERGEYLLDEFTRLRAEDLSRLLPELEALKASQESVYSVIEQIRAQEGK